MTEVLGFRESVFDLSTRHVLVAVAISFADSLEWTIAARASSVAETLDTGSVLNFFVHINIAIEKRAGVLTMACATVCLSFIVVGVHGCVAHAQNTGVINAPTRDGQLALKAIEHVNWTGRADLNV